MHALSPKRFMAFFFIFFSLITNSHAYVLKNWGDGLYGLPKSQILPWAGGWTHFVPFNAKSSGMQHFLAYNQNNGEVHFNRFNKDGSSFEMLSTAKWGAGWSHFTTFKLGDQNYLMAYNKTSGEVHYDLINNDGRGIQVLWKGRWASGWSHFVPFSVGAKPALIVYNQITGDVRFDWINSNLQGNTTVSAFKWGTGWTHLSSAHNGSTWNLLAYNAATGIAHYDEISSALNGTTTLVKMSLGTNKIVGIGQLIDPKDFKLRINEVFAYDATSGEINVIRPRKINTTTILEFPVKAHWPANLTHIQPFFLQSSLPFDGLLLSYNKNQGGARFLRLNDRSKMNCNGSDSCTFKNVPLLNQTDPKIDDTEWADFKAAGCYDTSIVMTSIGAMNNASLSTPRSNTRSSFILERVAQYGINSHQHTIYQYQTAKEKLPYHHHNLLTDYTYASSPTVTTYPKSCALSTIYSCRGAVSPLVDFSAVGANEKQIFDNMKATRILQSGALMIFAFDWSTNQPLPQGYRSVKSNPSAPHKIAIVGFNEKHSYPLVAYDPGNGAQMRIRIVNLRFVDKFEIFDNTGTSRKSWPAIQYEGSTTYQLLDHIDHIRVY